ncbi:MAG TPA: hypothetical protein VLY65_02750 [Nitrososphaerales archaeon]|nr:hypothetical protein [Nitrososphaerales archaeon]
MTIQREPVDYRRLQREREGARQQRLISITKEAVQNDPAAKPLLTSAR